MEKTEEIEEYLNKNLEIPEKKWLSYEFEKFSGYSIERMNENNRLMNFHKKRMMKHLLKYGVCVMRFSHITLILANEMKRNGYTLSQQRGIIIVSLFDFQSEKISRTHDVL